MLGVVLLPAHAGMFPGLAIDGALRLTAPRARGDVPDCETLQALAEGCSPRTRGCSLVTHVRQLELVLLPAHAGMFPRGTPGTASPSTAPRARGDVPAGQVEGGASVGCSPRTRGCSPERDTGALADLLLPAHAGMFPGPSRRGDGRPAAPRARGDVPAVWCRRRQVESCSPRTRGCSFAAEYLDENGQLLPAHAGMFPSPTGPGTTSSTAPRARGDVPGRRVHGPGRSLCSPRTRGCSQVRIHTWVEAELLPAHAGMFPRRRRRCRRWGSAPRARGDVPHITIEDAMDPVCSGYLPRCTRGRGLPCVRGDGMFPPAGSRLSPTSAAPRAREDAPNSKRGRHLAFFLSRRLRWADFCPRTKKSGPPAVDPEASTRP